MACHTVAFILVIMFQCIPIDAVFDVSIPGKCLNLEATTYAGACVSIFEDVVIILLPLFVLRDLNLNLKKKVGLGMVFSLGSL